MAEEERGRALAEIGARVRHRRRELNLTQEGLGEAAGLSKSFVSEVESGLTSGSGLVYSTYLGGTGLPQYGVGETAGFGIAACLKAWRADRWTALETEPRMVAAE